MPKRTTRKPTGNLAAFAATQKQKTALIGDIQAHVVKKSSQDHSRRQDIIHPSEMAKSDLCPRAIVYRISGAEPSNDKTPNGHHLETIFQEGHDIHSKWQTWLAEMGRLWGKWWCPACGKTEWGTGALSCEGRDLEDGSHEGHSPVLMEYREVPLDAEVELMMAGHADGAVPDIKAFIEIKSIGLGTLRMEEPDLVRQNTKKTDDGKKVVDYDSIWKGLKRPLKSHRIQAGIYLAIAKILGWDYDRMVFIYENKANQQTKEFVIRYPAELVDPLIDTAKDIKWAVENGRLLDRPEGFTKQLKPCSDCIFRDLCWEEEDGKVDSQESNSGNGARKPRSEAENGSPRDPSTQSAKGRVSRAAGRPHRTVRQRTDDAVHDNHEVVGVPQRTVGDGRGRRTVRRSRAR